MQQDVAIVGCGSIGRALGVRLVRATEVARVLATTTTTAKLAQLRGLGLLAHRVDLADRDALADVVRGADLVYLTAAARGPAEYGAVYRDGMHNLLDATRGARVRRIVVTSSTGVYSQRDGRWVDEETDPAPASVTARILVDAERELLTRAPALGITATVIRLGGIVGPTRGPQNAAARLAGTSRDDGDAFLNLVHEDDVVEGLFRLVTTPYAGILNLTSGRPVTRREFYDPLLARQGLAPVQWLRPGPDRDDRGKRVRSARIREVLGLSSLRAPVP